jgi:hypothetical protein
VDVARGSITTTSSKSKSGAPQAARDRDSVVVPTIDRPLANPIAEASRAAASKPTIVAATAGAGKSRQSGRIPKTDSTVTSHAVAPKPARKIREATCGAGKQSGWRRPAKSGRVRLAEGRSVILMGLAFLPRRIRGPTDPPLRFDRKPACRAAPAATDTRGGLAVSRSPCSCP